MRLKHIAAIALLTIMTMPAHAGSGVSADGMAAARLVGAHCPGQWEAPACLKAVSQSNLTMVSNYGENLQQSRKAQAAEQLKEHCAASTAATSCRPSPCFCRAGSTASRSRFQVPSVSRSGAA